MSTPIPVAGNICSRCGAHVVGERIYWNDVEWQHWNTKGEYLCGPVDSYGDKEDGKK